MKTIKRLVLLWIFLLPFTLISAQTTVTGIVTDATGDPLLGATVVVKGTQTTTITDIDGNYTIRVNDIQNDVLIFSYIGMETETLPVKGKQKVDLVMKDDDDVQLNEVVVIGYGTAKKKDLTGSVASIHSDELEKIPVSTIGEALTGRLAGVQVVTTDGAPDAEIKINVRGSNSITQSSEPLYIVDGFPVSSIADLTPSNVASVDVLKDASATAIYGSRGSNGVIIITTKSAKDGKMTLNVNAYMGFRNMTHAPKVMGAYEYVRWQYDYAMYRNNSVASVYEPYFGTFEDMDVWKDVAYNDWKKIALGRTAETQNYNANLSGSSGKLRYTVNAAYESTQGILIGSDYRRTNLSLKLNHQTSNKVTLDFQARFFDTEVSGSGTNESSGGRNSDPRMKTIMQYYPVPLKIIAQDDDIDDEDTYNNTSGLYTPTQYIADNDRKQYRKGFNMQGGFTWNILPALKFRTNLGANYTWFEDQRFYGMTTYYSRMNALVKNKPAIGMTNMTASSIINSNTLDYDFKKFMPRQHKLTLLLGEETLMSDGRSQSAGVDGLPESFSFADCVKYASQGTPASFNNVYNTPDRLLSFFTRANYSIYNKYLLTATFRADGSSKFAGNNQWGYFPSIAAGWRISEEKFLNKQNWLYNLKLRLSYGLSGNNNIPAGQTMTEMMSSANTTILPFTSSIWTAGSTLINPKLKWETTTTRNVGLDYGFFKGRLSGTVDVYLNTTDDLLIRFPITGDGYSSEYRNLGSTENRGVEFSITANAIKKKDFKLDFSFNISMNKNKVTDLGNLDNIQAYSGWASTEVDYDFIVRKGEPLGQIWGYVSDGRYAASEFIREGNAWVRANEDVVDNSVLTGYAWGPGALKLKDLNGDHKITADSDRKILGNTLPKATGGFSVNAQYKGFDLNANFSYSYGNKVLNVNNAFLSTTGKYRYLNLLTDFDSNHRWKGIDDNGRLITDTQVLEEINQNTTMWSPLTGNARFVSSYIVEDGSYLRLGTLTVGYTLPEKLTRKHSIRSLRFYATGTNLFCLTNYSGFDPEVNSRGGNPLTPGVDYSSYPKTQGVIFGLNLNF
ncbi:MAG: TonB-dependent receptor [Candidatus Symbiothrix sp.]|jgi:TonB-linked SusC/RagA family outer membrane protein|nr:TonB-dependent receptor [Candidatus Symbiothrix sp.]